MARTACLLLACATAACGSLIASSAHRTIHDISDSTVGTAEWAWQSYKSSSLKPPYPNITGDGAEDALDPAYLFFTPEGDVKGSYPCIMRNDGELVYAADISDTTDFRMQLYDGEPHLTFWSGYNTLAANTGHGYGIVHFLDRELNNFTLSPDIDINTLLPTSDTPGIVDIHEHQMTASQQSMLITMYNNTPADLESFGVKDGWVVDSIVAEIEIKTSKVLFLWNPHDHGVQYNESKVPLSSDEAGNGTKAAPYDWCHINSAHKVGSNYLINSRHLFTTWLVNGSDGSIIWAIQGETGGDFGKLPDGVTFSWQHFARAHNVSDAHITLSIFNNHNNEALPAVANGSTTGLLLELALPPSKHDTPVILRNLTVPSDEVMVGSQGSYTPELSNGNALMGYGEYPLIREYGSEDGGTNQKLLRQWNFGLRKNDTNVAESYRAYKMEWDATPANWDPSLVVEKSGKKVHAYVSWNGATDVTHWKVSAGSSRSDLAAIGKAERKGFETTFAIADTYKCVQVEAVKAGKDVRKSNVACT